MPDSISQTAGPSASELVRIVLEVVEAAVAEAGTTEALDPGRRVRFHWPPHPPSYDFHVLASDWSGRATFEAEGEVFEVEVARTPNGVFGRCPKLWHEARGDTEADMLVALKAGAEPLFKRQRAISKALGRTGRFDGPLRDLSPADLLRLLYCSDRDVANDARVEIETHASLGVFGPALIEVLKDRRHPNRRSAQWCVLDIFEDLPRLCPTVEMQEQAIQAIRSLLWDAEDDYARTVYKAGVVLGGHLPSERGGPVLVECLEAPSRVGRRSAIHGLFHVVEWNPESRADVVAALRSHAETETEALLAKFALDMADDIEQEKYDHVEEPKLPEDR